MATKTKKPVKKSKLAPLNVKLQEKPVKKGEVLTVHVNGDYPTRYNEASALAKQAAQLMSELKPLILPHALSHIYSCNAEKPWEPITSVAFQDDNDNVLRVSNTAKYPELDATAVEELSSEKGRVDAERQRLRRQNGGHPV
jgi:hypothetical protein